MTLDENLLFFVSCPPGLESMLTQECQSFGFSQKNQKQPPAHLDKSISGEDVGGLLFEGSLTDIYRANLSLRIASRIVIRLCEFISITFAELRKKASKLAWEKYIRPGQSVNIRTVCHKSRLYHSDAVSERILNAINDHFSTSSKSIAPIHQSSDGQMILVRLVNDICTISIDSSGDPLYKRGYKLAVAKAPLRENLAAAMVAFSGWEGSNPVIDPFCGSGTIPIEAALIASQTPPGIARNFRFTYWPIFDEALWRSVKESSVKEIKVVCTEIFGYDRDAGAIDTSKENAARAGQKDTITFLQQALSYLESPSPQGTIITNPPYGVRISGNKDLRDLYSRFGTILREKFTGWKFTLLSPDVHLSSNLRIGQPVEELHFSNGGIPVSLLKFNL